MRISLSEINPRGILEINLSVHNVKIELVLNVDVEPLYEKDDMTQL